MKIRSLPAGFSEAGSPVTAEHKTAQLLTLKHAALIFIQ